MFEKLISFSEPKAKASEAFRTLRTNIQYSTLHTDLKIILATSSGASEGKSTILANLAVTFAQTDKKVLILDCDLRKPSIHKQFELTNSFGLTNLMIDKSTLEEAVLPTKIPNLFAITCGPIPPDPSEILGSMKMRKFLEDIKASFDVILIDAPPVLAVTDAQILATMSDGVLIITSYKEVEKRALKRAQELLDKVGANILGLVLNKIPENEGHRYYKKNYYKDYYQYTYGK